MLSEFLQILKDTLFIINIFFAIFIVFSGRKNPAVTWAWLMVSLVIPYFGFIVYLMLGFDGRKHRVFYYKNKKDDKVYKSYLNMDINSIEFLNRQMEIIKSRNILNINGAEHLNDMIYLNFISGHGAYSTNNNINVYHDGKSKFDSLLKDIKNAKHFIHMQYYIVRNDELSKKIIQALAIKARQGVEVCFLIDGMGCVTTSKRLFKPLIESGGKFAIFLPPHFIRLNFRNHRKLAIIDGSIGYIGGLNIGKEYLGESKRFGYWRDAHIKIEGEAVRQLEVRFIMDWNFTSRNHNICLDTKYFPQITNKKHNIPIQIVSSGPDTKWHSIHHAYTKMISEADKSIYIQTPYFVPDDSILEAIRIAALSGIDVKIIIPANPDHPFVYWAGISYLGELLNVGVKCYQYEKGFVHSKLIIVDGLVSSIGTANMDVRSFKLNFEINAFIYDEKISKKLEKQFIADLSDCSQIDLNFYMKRSNFTKVREAVSRLLSPML